MKQKLLALAISAMLLLSLSACGGSNGAADNSGYQTTADSGATYNGWAVNESAPAAAETPKEYAGYTTMDAEADVQQSSALATAKIIYTAEMHLETQAFDSVTQALDQMVEELGGYYESRSIYSHSTYRSASYTVRVPADQFRHFCDQTGELAHRTRMDENNQNVSEAYYDTEARLTTQRTKLERLLVLLEQAATMEDIISLETAISDTELEIEYLTGSLRKYDSLIDYSTVTIYLDEVYKLSNEEEPATTFGQRLSSALSTGLQRGIDGLEELLIGLARNWLVIVLVLTVVTVLILLLRRRIRRIKAAQAARQLPVDDPPAGGSEGQ